MGATAMTEPHATGGGRSVWGTRLDCAQAALRDDPFVRAFAPPASGKTTFLVQRVATLVRRGVDPACILVVANTPAAAGALRGRLRAAGADHPEPTVCTAFEALAHLSVPPEADRAAGRGPRLLMRAEFNVVLEDLKYAGIPVAVLRGLTAAMAHGHAAGLEPGSWELDEEQGAAYRELERRLRDLGAMLPAEVPSAALRRLRGAHARGEAAPYGYVLVDDAQNLGAATLEALALLAGEQVVLAGNPNQTQAGFDAAFEPGAFAAFGDAHEAFDIELADGCAAPGPAAVAAALCDRRPVDPRCVRRAEPQDGAGRDAVTYIKWRTPDDEFRGVARIVRNLLAADRDLSPQDVCVAVPNRTWARAVCTELTARRIPAQVVTDADPVSGDPRSRGHLGSLEAYGFLALAADSDDPAAWRFWLALGDRDLACTAWEGLRTFARDAGLTIRQAVESAARGAAAFPGADLVSARAHRAGELLGAAADKHGFALRDLVRTVWGDGRVSAVLDACEGNEDATGLFATFQKRSLTPCFADRPSQVRVGTYRIMRGISPCHLLAPGLVDGVVPAAKPADDSPAARRARRAQRRALGDALGTARASLTVSTCQRADADLAARLRLPVHRMRLYQGREVALLARSPFIDDAGDALPGSVSGEQFFGTDGCDGIRRCTTGAPVVVHRHRCVRVRNRHAACRACADACPESCIRLDGGKPVLDIARCIGCGTCCTVCPTCALEATEPNDAALFDRALRAAQAADGTAIFATPETLARADASCDPAKAVPVRRLGRVDETLVVRLAAAGIDNIVLVQPHTDDPVGRNKDLETARTVCAGANAILAAWDSGTRARLAEELPSCVAVASRNAPNPQTVASPSETGMRLPADASKGPAAYGETGISHSDPAGASTPCVNSDAPQRAEADPASRRMRVMKDGTLPHFLPDRREELLDALSDLGQPVDAVLTTRLWGHVSIDPGLCTGCRLCATFCPTGALFKFKDDDGTTGIGHAPGDCVQCRCCQDVCRAGAISVENAVHAPDILTGAVERHPMPPEELFRSRSDSIYRAVKKALNIDCLIER